MDGGGRGAGVGVLGCSDGRTYPEPVMKEMGSAPDTGRVRQSCSASSGAPSRMKPTTSTGSRRRVSAEDALALWREYKAHR